MQRKEQASFAPVVLLCAFSLALALFQYQWFKADCRIPFWDQLRYFDMTRSADQALTEGRLGNLLDLHPSHPPLYPLLGAVYGHTLGDTSYAVVRTLNVLLAILLVFASYALLRKLHLSPLWATLGAMFASMAPLGVAFGHMYYLENLLSVLVVLGWTVFLPRPPEHLAGWMLGGLICGLGCLTKWTFPVFMVIPAVVAFPRVMAKPGHAAAALATMALVAGPWYWSHWGGILAFLGSGVSGGEGELGAIRGLQGWIYYPVRLALSGVGLPLVFASCFGALVMLKRERRTALVIFGVFLVCWLVFSSLLTKKPRHLLPTIPLVGALTAYGLQSIRARFIQNTLAILLIAFVAVASYRVSFGWHGSHPEPRIPGVPLPLLTWDTPPGPPDGTSWPYDAVFATIDEQLRSAGSQQVLVTFNTPAMREEGFRFHGANDPQRPLTSLIPFAHLTPDDRFPLERSDEETPGLLDLPLILTTSQTAWIPYQSGLDAHHHGTRVSEALQDPSGPLSSLYRSSPPIVLPDGGLMRVFAPISVADAQKALARFTLMNDPGHPKAWELLGRSPTFASDAARGRALETHGVVPEGFWMEPNSSVDAESHLRDLLKHHAHREDVWRLVIGRAPVGSALRGEAVKVLELWHRYRVRDARRAAIDLAKHFHSQEHRAPAWTWMRRAAEAQQNRLSELRDSFPTFLKAMPRDPIQAIRWIRSQEQQAYQ